MGLLLKARRFPFEIPEWAVGVAVEITNRDGPKEYNLVYRYDNSGNIVELTTSQKTKIEAARKEGKNLLFANTKKEVSPSTQPPGESEGNSATQIGASDKRDPNTDSTPAGIQSADEEAKERIQELLTLKSQIREQLRQLDAMVEPTRLMLVRDPSVEDTLQMIGKILRIPRHPMTNFLTGELRYHFLRTSKIYDIALLYKNATSMSKQIQDPSISKKQRYELIQERKGYLDQLETLRKWMDDQADDDTYPYPTWQEMLKFCIDTRSAIVTRTKEEWTQDILDREVYLNQVQSEIDELELRLRGPEPEIELIDLATIPKEDIIWADEIIDIPTRSREMTQLQRRTHQSRDGKARYYFGVNDDGSLTSEKRAKDVAKFALHFMNEMEDEGHYKHELNFLDEDQFLLLQASFPSKHEVETGAIEYKSTGQHIDNLPDLPQDFPKFRVIELLIERSIKVTLSDSKLFNPAPPDHGPPVMGVIVKRVRVPQGILRVSRYRQPCWKERGFNQKPEKEKQMLRAKDQEDIASAIALSHTLSAVTTALLMSRQEGHVDLMTIELPRDIDLYKSIHEIQREIIGSWMDNGHNVTGQELKEASTQLRMIWQTGQAKDLNRFSKMFLKYLDHTMPKFNNDARMIEVDGNQLTPPTYGLCVVGTLGRALPPPPQVKVEGDTWDTYERFKEATAISEDLATRVEEWAYTFFKDMPSPSSMNLTPAGSSGCLERPRSLGGIGTLVSDYYHVIKGIEDLTTKGLHSVNQWREKWKDFPPLMPGNIAQHQQRVGEFTYALALDLCKNNLDHYKTCTGPSCAEEEMHFPLVPFGIPERGHKTRVPCLGSGFFNILQQPIRESMFSVIRKDIRCKYRTRGGTKKESLAGFLRSFERNMLSHAGDLKVSTDNFSSMFNKALIRGIGRTGKVSSLELLIMEAATGCFRMIAPDDGITQLSVLRPTPFNYCSEKPQPDEMVLSDIARKIYQKYLKMPAKETHNDEGVQLLPLRKNCLRCEKYLENCYCNAGPQVLAPLQGNKSKEWGKAPNHNGFQWRKGKKEVDLKLEKSNFHPAFCLDPHTSENPAGRHGIGFFSLEPDYYNWDHEKILDRYLQKQSAILDFCGNEHYLTKKGVQMSQAISIVTLYSYNLFADTQSVLAGGRGMSLLCGDDSLRTGDETYIYRYREVIEQLGGVWSPTKDVVGTTGNGIFTEQHFSYGRVHDIPKVRSVARYDSDNIPGWVKAIQSSQQVEFPRDPGSGNTHKQGLELLLDPYKSDLDELRQFLPIGLPTILGGLGDNSPLHWKTEECLRRLPSVEDKPTAAKCLKKVLKCLHPEPIKTKRQWKLDLTVQYPSERTSTLERAIGFHQGTYRWIYLETQSLRSALEAAAMLENPSYPVEFDKQSNFQVVTRHLARLDQVLELAPEVDDDINVTRLINTCYHYDVPTETVRRAIGPEVSEKLSFQTILRF